MSESEVQNTILHEIAHALVGEKHGHDRVWRKKAIEIGCDGNRLSNYKAIQLVEGKYVAICKACGQKHIAHRKLKHNYWCACDKRKFVPEMKLDYIQQY